MAVTLVLVDEVNATPVVLAGVAKTLHHLAVADLAHVTRVTVAAVGGDAVAAGAVVTGLWNAVVNIVLAQLTRVAFSTFTFVAVGSVLTLGSVQTGGAGALINVYLTHLTAEAWWTFTDVAVDLVDAPALVQTGGAHTLIYVHLTMRPLKSRHANAGVVSYAVQTCAIVLAWRGGTLVDVELTAWPRVAPGAVTGERAVRVHTVASVLAGLRANVALVHVLFAGASLVACGAVALEHSVDGVGVTLGPVSAGTADAGIVHMTQQTSLAKLADAQEVGDSVHAGGPRSAGSRGAVVNVLAAVQSTPAVHTHTRVAARHIAAGAPVLTGVGLQATLVHVLGAELTSPFWRTLAVVRIYTIHACPSILTAVSRAVVYVVLTVSPIETWQTVTVVAGVEGLSAGSPVDAG